MFIRLTSAVLLASTWTADAVRLLSSLDLLTTTEYDFVIVGGGTAGLVLASRLSEDFQTTVLVIEAGGNDRDYPDAEVPFLAANLEFTGADWNYTTTPQSGYNNRSINFERGHVLGGSSTVNYMAYNRASNDVYDRWANITNDAGWRWSALEQYYLENSRLVAPADGRNYTEEVLESAHGNGPVEVSVPGNPYLLDHKVIDTSKELGGRYMFNQDLNAGNFVGISWSQSAIAGWKRSSAATAYLHPLIDDCHAHSSLCRKNLDILTHTQVTRLLASNSTNCLDFDTMEIAQSTTSKPMRVTARNEIILSAGVIGTPKILMQSGIGPSSTLEALNITAIVDLPSVGQNLTDHPLNALYFSVTANTTVDPILQNRSIMQKALETWNSTHRGPLTNSASNIIGMLRLPANASILSSIDDPAAGPLSSNEELLFAEGFVPLSNIPLPSSGNYITVLSIVTSPTSRGAVTLNSSDPFTPPVIDPRYLTTEFDEYTAVQAIRDAFAILAAPAFEGYIASPYGPLVNVSLTSDEELLAYVRQHGVTINHGVGTAKMSAYGADWGVVNPDLKVKGVSGVRVVDASVFPEIPECHTMAPVYIIAERAADIIKEAHGLAS